MIRFAPKTDTPAPAEQTAKTPSAEIAKETGAGAARPKKRRKTDASKNEGDDDKLL